MAHTSLSVRHIYASLKETFNTYDYKLSLVAVMESLCSTFLKSGNADSFMSILLIYICFFPRWHQFACSFFSASPQKGVIILHVYKTILKVLLLYGTIFYSAHHSAHHHCWWRS